MYSGWGMADRYSFQSPFSRGAAGDPWFTVGSVAVTTTVAVTALGALGILLFVVEAGRGSVGAALELSNTAITRGNLWRLVTWFIPADGNFFFAIIGLIFFYMLGTQLETMMGRKPFASLVGLLLVAPALLAVLVGVAVRQDVHLDGMSMIFLGVAAAFAATVPQARSFFGIPFWVVVAFFFVISLLSVLTIRSLPALIMLLSTAAIGLVWTRSLGFAPSVEWIPTVPVPGSLTGEGTPARDKPLPRKNRRRTNKAKTSHLSAVPSPTSDAEIDALLDQVSEHGIDSLTKDQKRILTEHSKEMRRRRES